MVCNLAFLDVSVTLVNVEFIFAGFCRLPMSHGSTKPTSLSYFLTRIIYSHPQWKVKKSKWYFPTYDYS